jgi:hypothetical protein
MRKCLTKVYGMAAGVNALRFVASAVPFHAARTYRRLTRRLTVLA